MVTVVCGQCDRPGEEEEAFVPPPRWAYVTISDGQGRHLSAATCSPQCAAFLIHEAAKGRRSGFHEMGAGGDECRSCFYALSVRESAHDRSEGFTASHNDFLIQNYDGSITKISPG